MRLAKRLVSIAAHALLLAGVIELLARVDDRLTYGAPWWGRYDYAVLLESDARGVQHNVPLARFEKWQINSLGFRGAELSLVKPGGQRRIACIGASETFGLYETAGAEWPAALGRLLRQTHPDVVAFNAAVVGPARFNRLAYLEEYVLPLRPDVAILYLNVLEYGYPLGSTTPVPRATPGPKEPEPWFTSRALPKVKSRLKAFVPDTWLEGLKKISMRRRLRQLEERELGGARPLDSLPEANVRYFEDAMRQVVTFLRTRGVEPVLATYPILASRENLDQHALQMGEERQYHVQLSDIGIVDTAERLNKSIRGLANELGTGLMDVDRLIPKTTEHFADMVHYTDRGAGLVAETALASLERLGLLSEASRSPTTRPIEEHRAPVNSSGR